MFILDLCVLSVIVTEMALGQSHVHTTQQRLLAVVLVCVFTPLLITDA